MRFDWLKLNNRTLHCEIVELDKQNKELWASISVLQAQIAVLRNFHITEKFDKQIDTVDKSYVDGEPYGSFRINRGEK